MSGCLNVAGWLARLMFSFERTLMRLVQCLDEGSVRPDMWNV